MKTKVISAISMACVLGASSAMASDFQHEGHAAKKAMTHDHGDHMMMANEPHHLLAMAYHQNLATFAKVLHEQTDHAASVDVAFARTAEIEMRRSFGEMKLHHEEHVKTMSAEMHTKMSGMRKQMETHHTELIALLDALEKEVNLAKPDVKKVSTLAANIHAHCDAMSKMDSGHQERKSEKASD